MPENEMETLLRGVAGELYVALRDLPVENNIPLCFERVLLRESGLLRLLEAGQQMHDDLKADPDCSGEHIPWEIALAAMKEKVSPEETEQPSASQEFDARAECGYCHRALGRHEECYCDEYVRSAVRAAIPRTIHSDSLFDSMVELVKSAYAAGKREGQHGR